MSPTVSEWSALRAGKITGVLTVPDRFVLTVLLPLIPSHVLRPYTLTGQGGRVDLCAPTTTPFGRAGCNVAGVGTPSHPEWLSF